MRRIFLIRHAKAEPAVGQEDYDRALTDRGRLDARCVAASLAERDMLPERLVHSGALRALQTAQTFAAQWPRRVELKEEFGLYDATQAMLYERTRALSDDIGQIGFVGHNPGVGELASTLAGTGAHPELRRMALKYPTCAVAVIDFDISCWSDVDRKAGLLALFLTPAELEAEAD